MTILWSKSRSSRRNLIEDACIYQIKTFRQRLFVLVFDPLYSCTEWFGHSYHQSPLWLQLGTQISYMISSSKSYYHSLQYAFQVWIEIYTLTIGAQRCRNCSKLHRYLLASVSPMVNLFSSQSRTLETQEVTKTKCRSRGHWARKSQRGR